MSGLPNVTGPRVVTNRMLNPRVEPRVTLPVAPKMSAMPMPHIPPMRTRFDQGGIVDSPAAPFTGPILHPSAGRADTVPMHVPHEAYVIPADIVSHLGQGNSLAGHELLSKMFGSPWGAGRPWGAPGPQLPMGHGPPQRMQPRVMGFPHYPIYAGGPGGAGLSSYGPPAGMRSRGGVPAHGVGAPVPIMASGGEFVIPPQSVARVGHGDVNLGHKALDAWVLGLRKEAVDTLKKLPGPEK